MVSAPFALERPTVTVLGCGYVGVTTAVVLANCGYNVYAIEPMPVRLDILKTGKSFFYEAGVDPLIANALKHGTLVFTNSYEASVPNSSIIFSCVGTPDYEDGSSDLTYVFEAAQHAAKLVKPGAIFVQKSTVPVGTGAQVEQVFAKANAEVRYVSNPEFLAESSAIRDTLWFDRIVTGSEDRKAAQAILDLYKIVEEHADDVGKIAGLQPPTHLPKPHYINTARNSAELIKVSANAFLALKITFANSIAKLADKSDADITEVMQAVGADRRIGSAFLNAGRGYGGGCFPKDVSGLIRTAEDFGVNMEIMHAMVELNASMPHYIIEKVALALNSPTLQDKKVAILGLAFKAGTSDSRRSPAVVMANTLAEQGTVVTAYDPQAALEAKHELHDAVHLAHSLDEAVQSTDVVFVATDWPEFIHMDIIKLAKLSGAKLFVDCMNRFDRDKFAGTTLKYIGVGRN